MMENEKLIVDEIAASLRGLDSVEAVDAMWEKLDALSPETRQRVVNNIEKLYSDSVVRTLGPRMLAWEDEKINMDRVSVGPEARESLAICQSRLEMARLIVKEKGSEASRVMKMLAEQGARMDMNTWGSLKANVGAIIAVYNKWTGQKGGPAFQVSSEDGIFQSITDSASAEEVDSAWHNMDKLNLEDRHRMVDRIENAFLESFLPYVETYAAEWGSRGDRLDDAKVSDEDKSMMQLYSQMAVLIHVEKGADTDLLVQKVAEGAQQLNETEWQSPRSQINAMVKAYADYFEVIAAPPVAPTAVTAQAPRQGRHRL
jgi:hypothetical protein